MFIVPTTRRVASRTRADAGVARQFFIKTENRAAVLSAQVWVRLGIGGCAMILEKKSLPCVKGGAERKRGGGIVSGIHETIPQSPFGDSPLYTRGP